MPGVITGGGTTTYLTLLPAAPTTADSASTFPTIANSFFNAIWVMVENVNLTIRTYPATALTELPTPPQALDTTFAADADTFLASLPGLRTGVNAIITALSLPCSAITALPTIPSRGGDPVNFASRAAALVAALPAFRTELNAFITALIAYDPAHPYGVFLFGNNIAPSTNTAISGDIQVGVCAVASASGTAHSIVIRGSTAAANPSLVFRLCIYAATGTTTWGTLLGKTADVTGLGLNEVKSVPLISPVSIVSGQFYAVTVHFASGSSGSSASNGVTYADLGFGDTFSDGPVNPASAPGTNSSNGRIIYVTT